ncbi:Ankyrin repeat protein [Pleurostoma richardsiae]|uniref:Ankyrin repeat protein n=1 Tax=Pleurostoma richardsiae TaxID=41990 RepID=A0AA38VFE0_9PEZI|nr:Ankyrin repeat protein [Pleurostoma richardsiae]
MDQKETHTCLTALEHEPKMIRDHFQHYFGCIKISEREQFWDHNNEIWQYEEEEEFKKLNSRLREQEARAQAKEIVKARIGTLAVSVETQYKRIDILRSEIAKNTAQSDPGSDRSCENQPTTQESLVEQVTRSHGKWRRTRSAEKAAGDALREQANPTVAVTDSTDTNQQTKETYCLERDTNAYLIQYEKGTHRGNHEPPGESSKRSDRVGSTSQEVIPNGVGHLQPVDEHPTNWRFKGRFPDQRVALQYLLKKPTEEEDVIVHKDKHRERIRYFHVPSNNMEKLIAQYFGDEPPRFDGLPRNGSEKTRAYMLLRSEFWRGQQHGLSNNNIVHARHLRPLCETVSSDIDKVEDTPNNIVLFMPYLHWETDSRRERIARIIDEEVEKERKKIECSNAEMRARMRLRNGSPHPRRQPIRHKAEIIESNILPQMPMRTMTEVINAKLHKNVRHKGRYLPTFENGGLKVASELGQFLIDSAKLYEAISCFRDKKLLEEYLHKEPPLHPRRTLDQSYYWTLKTTKARDRDQVVYRGTTMNAELAHRLRTQDQEPVPKWKKFWPKKGEGVEQWQWDNHTEWHDKNGCEQCRSDIRKISRVIMVDQLWMWILDENTILTFFPRRYGINKKDESGVHRSIRARVKHARKDQIRSVFDLALIILDECSNIFFDRTKTEDRQLQAMDIFAEAIGNVSHRQTNAFEHLWHWTKKACTIYRSMRKNVDASQLHVPLLDIHPEGKLQKEINDIIDELDMMIHINKKQREVIRRFQKQVEHIMDPSGDFRAMRRDWDEANGLASPRSSSTSNGQFSSPPADDSDKAQKRNQFVWFTSNASELISEVEDRLEELNGLRQSAERTATSVKDLLDLKQQQASVVQTWQSVKQAEETVKQGRAIIMFTTVTIVFLPLSFMSSIFGMNNSEFQDGSSWSLGEQLRLMLPISAGIILVTVILAFSNLLRAIIWSAYMYVTTHILVYTGLYWCWLALRDEWSSQTMMLRTEEKVAKMKEEVRRKREVRRGERNAARRERRKADQEQAEKEAEGLATKNDKEKRTQSKEEKKPIWKKFSRRHRKGKKGDTTGTTNGTTLGGEPVASGAAAPRASDRGHSTANGAQRPVSRPGQTQDTNGAEASGASSKAEGQHDEGEETVRSAPEEQRPSMRGGGRRRRGFMRGRKKQQHDEENDPARMV